MANPRQISLNNVPREIDEILDDADDVRLPEWRKVGNFEILESTLGIAILGHLEYESAVDMRQTPGAHALVRYPDRVAVDLGTNSVVHLKRACERALRERPEARQTLDLDEDAAPVPPPDPLEEAAEADPFTPAPKPAPRAWRTVPIGSADDD